MPAKERADCHNTEERVYHIAQMMADGSYLGGYKIRAVLAEDWGVSDATIRGYAAEAHRVVSFDPEEREHLRRTIAARMLDIADRAKAAFNIVTGMPDFKAEREALLDHAKFAGIELDEKSAPAAIEPVTIQIVYHKDTSEDRPEQVPSSESSPLKTNAG